MNVDPSRIEYDMKDLFPFKAASEDKDVKIVEQSRYSEQREEGKDEEDMFSIGQFDED